jgi:ABC-type hemin transport system substrate-binding protein
VLARAPAVVIVGSHAERETPLKPLEELATSAGPRRFRVVTVDGDLVFRPGPRVVDGLDALDRLLHEAAK